MRELPGSIIPDSAGLHPGYWPLPLRVRRILAPQFLIENPNALPIRSRQAAFPAEIQVEAKPYELLDRDAVLHALGLNRDEGNQEGSPYARISGNRLSSSFGVIGR